MTRFTIDISNNQGSKIDLSTVLAEGFAGVQAKVSEGNYYRDWTWPIYRDAANALGIPVIGYHYAIANSSPASQVQTFIANGGGNVVMLDFEANSGNIGDYWNLVNAFNAAGIEVTLSYIPRWYWAGSMGGGDLSKVPGLISSGYYGSGNYASALYAGAGGDSGTGWASYGGGTPVMWQFTDGASVAGYSVDANAHKGSAEEFNALFNGGNADMQLTDTITDAYGNPVSVGDALKWLLYHTDLLVDQDGGPGTRNGMPAQFGGWPQLGGRTIIDALATIGQKLQIDGFNPPAKS